MESVNKKVSVFSLWRDSESYIQRTLKQLESLEQNNPEILFSYFFYENDSVDNTVSILQDWLKLRSGKFLSESYPRYNFQYSGPLSFLNSEGVTI